MRMARFDPLAAGGDGAVLSWRRMGEGLSVGVRFRLLCGCEGGGKMACMDGGGMRHNEYFRRRLVNVLSDGQMQGESVRITEMNYDASGLNLRTRPSMQGGGVVVNCFLSLRWIGCFFWRRER